MTPIETAITEAQERLAQILGEIAEVQAQARAINDRGVGLEKTMLGIEGELRALKALQGESVPRG